MRRDPAEVARLARVVADIASVRDVAARPEWREVFIDGSPTQEESARRIDSAFEVAVARFFEALK